MNTVRSSGSHTTSASGASPPGVARARRADRRGKLVLVDERGGDHRFGGQLRPVGVADPPPELGDAPGVEGVEPAPVLAHVGVVGLGDVSTPGASKCDQPPTWSGWPWVNTIARRGRSLTAPNRRLDRRGLEGQPGVDLHVPVIGPRRGSCWRSPSRHVDAVAELDGVRRSRRPASMSRLQRVRHESDSTLPPCRESTSSSNGRRSAPGSTTSVPASWRGGPRDHRRVGGDHPGRLPEGREVLYGRCVDALWNRLRVVDHLARHPEVARRAASSGRWSSSACPAPARRSPATCSTRTRPAARCCNWEARDSVPPATTATLRTDPAVPRQEGGARRARRRSSRRPGSPSRTGRTPTGPPSACSCRTRTSKRCSGRRCMPVARYVDWFLEQPTSTSAYEYERSVLQVLQSKAPGTWSLKMPSHAVHIEALLAIFPDARHRLGPPRPVQGDGVGCCSMYQLCRRRIRGPELDPAPHRADASSGSCRRMSTARCGPASASATIGSSTCTTPTSSAIRSARCAGSTRGPATISRRRSRHRCRMARAQPAGPLRRAPLLARRVRAHPGRPRAGVRGVPHAFAVEPE